MREFSMFKIERRPTPSGGAVLLVSAAAVVAALIAVGILLWAYGIPPLHGYRTFFRGSLGTIRGLRETMRNTIPLLLCGVGLTLAFRVRFWNIGAEGQLLMGAVAASGVALFSNLPASLLLPAMFLAGFGAGGVWGVISAVLKTKLGVNDVITTLMLNYIAVYLVYYLVHGPWRAPGLWGLAFSDFFPAAALIPVIHGTRIHWPTLVMGFLFAIALYVLVTHTKRGFEICVVGENPDAARFAGINHTKAILFTVLISGGLAGIAGVGEVAGVHHLLRSPGDVSLGFGFSAIIVAWLARRNPLAVVLTAPLFGAMMAGGVGLRGMGVSFQVVNVLQGLIVFFLIGGELLMNYNVSFSLRKR